MNFDTLLDLLLKESGGFLEDCETSLKRLEKPCEKNEKEALREAEKLIKSQFNFYGMRSNRPYLITTQNQNYLAHFLNEEIERACIVLGSGDTVFELIKNGVTNIDAVDINHFQKLIYLLKEAAILTLPFKDYRNFLLNADSKRFLSRDVYKVVSCALKDEKANYFWQELIARYSKEELLNGFFRKFRGDGINFQKLISIVPYLKNENSYNLVQERIRRVKINVIVGDILEYLKSNPDKTYDYIDITNILLFIFQLQCEFDPAKFQTLITSLKNILSSNLNVNGIFVLDYMFGTTVKKFDVREKSDIVANSFAKIYEITYDLLNKYFHLESFTVDKIAKLNSKPYDTIIYTRKK